MIEKDNIQELFSKAFENQTASVRPELWAGVQAKMAAAGVASTATVATKGLSALTKWIIGSAAVGTVGVVTTVIALNSGEESVNQKEQTPQKESVKVAATTEKTSAEHTLQLNTPTNSGNKETTQNSHTVLSNRENPENRDLLVHDLKLAEEPIHPADKKIEPKSDEKKGTEPVDKAVVDNKKTNPASAGTGVSKTTTSVSKGNEVSNKPNVPDEPKESINTENAVKISKFPNIFSPDGDHINDIYKVEVENLVTFKMTIVDDKNKEMFQTSDPNEGWDGRAFGEEAKPGSYAVFIDGKDLNGKDFHKAQIIILKR